MKATVLIGLCILGSCAHAQMMTPPKELQAFDWLIGEWKGTVKFFGMMSGEAPMTIKYSREGMFIKGESVMEMGGTKYTETAYMGWDAQKKIYTHYAFTNWAATPRIETGTWEGNTLKFLSEPQMVMGIKMTTRGEMVKVSDNEFTFTLENKVGEKWEKSGESRFKRVK